MRTLETEYGRVRVGEISDLYAVAAREARAGWRAAPTGGFSWALTGGTTPQAWYRWCVGTGALPPELVAETHWFVSDERRVTLASAESNFGNARRLLLEPLGAPSTRQHPWDTAAAPDDAARAMAAEVERVGGAGRGFSLCFLGLGDDAHTASLFPGSPLLEATATRAGTAPRFAALEVPGRGGRLTITPAGLRVCDRIVVLAVGAAKADAVRRVWRSDEPVSAVPAKVLRSCAAKTTWLLDGAAGAELGLARRSGSRRGHGRAYRASRTA